MMTSPIIRKLATSTMEDPKSNIRKIIVGKPNPNFAGPGKVLMLLGATGSGKSTLINGIVNYLEGVQYKDKYRYVLIEDEGSSSQAHSQTKCITAYSFQKHSLTVIDTPGYGDTEGLERDKKITKQIKDFFTVMGPKGIDQLNGIGFVVKAPDSRLTPTQRYIFDSILSMFGKDFCKNIFMLVTFADGNDPLVLTAIKEANIEFQKAFKFNNSALFANIEDECSDDDDDFMIFNSMYWKMGEKSFKHFFKIFNGAQSVSLQLTKEVLQKREHLECIIQNLQLNIQAGLSKADQLHQEEIVIKAHEKDLLTNKDFVYEVDVTKQRKIDLPSGQHVTNCLQCHMTCHYPCYIPRDEDKSGCAAMDSNSYCEVCPGDCYWNQHVNNGYRFELYMAKETRTSEELKKRYEEAKSKKTAAESVTAGLKKDLQNLYLAVFGMLRTANDSIRRLKEIALRPNPLSEIQYIELLISSEKMQKNPGFTRRIEALENVREQAKIIQEITDEKKVKQMLKNAAKYCWDKLKFW